MFDAPVVTRSQSCFERIASSPLFKIKEENEESEIHANEDTIKIEKLLREKEEDAHLINMLKQYSFALEKKIENLKTAVKCLNLECQVLKGAVVETDINYENKSIGLFAKAIEARNRKASTDIS